MSVEPSVEPSTGEGDNESSSSNSSSSGSSRRSSNSSANSAHDNGQGAVVAATAATPPTSSSSSTSNFAFVKSESLLSVSTTTGQCKTFTRTLSCIAYFHDQLSSGAGGRTSSSRPVTATTTTTGTVVYYPGTTRSFHLLLNLLRDRRLPNDLPSHDVRTLANDCQRIGLDDLAWYLTSTYPLQQACHKAKGTKHWPSALLALGDAHWCDGQSNLAMRKWCQAWRASSKTGASALQRQLGHTSFATTADDEIRGLAFLHMAAVDRLTGQDERTTLRWHQALRFCPSLHRIVPSPSTDNATFKEDVERLSRTRSEQAQPAHEGQTSGLFGSALNDSEDDTHNTAPPPRRSLHIDVRGTPFCIAPDAYKKVASDSALVHLLSNQTTMTGDDDHSKDPPPFLDIDPDVFELIDVLLCDGALPSGLDSAALSQLRQDAKYLGLDEVRFECKTLYPLREMARSTRNGLARQALGWMLLGNALYEIGRVHEANASWRVCWRTGTSQETISMLRTRLQRKKGKTHANDAATSTDTALGWLHYHLAVLLGLSEGLSSPKRTTLYHAEQALRCYPTLDVARRLVLATLAVRVRSWDNEAENFERIMAILHNRPATDTTDNGEVGTAFLQVMDPQMEAYFAPYRHEPSYLMLDCDGPIKVAEMDHTLNAILRLLRAIPRSEHYQAMFSHYIQSVKYTRPDDEISLVYADDDDDNESRLGRYVDQFIQHASAYTAEGSVLLRIANHLIPGDIERGQAILAVCRAKFPHNLITHQLRASILALTGQPSQAIIASQKAIDLDPTRAESWNFHASLAYKYVEKEQAIEPLCEALARCKDVTGRERDTFDCCIERLWELGQHDRVLQALDEHLRQPNVNDPERSITHARYLLHQKRIQDAYNRILTVMDDDPFDDEANYVYLEVLACGGAMDVVQTHLDAMRAAGAEVTLHSGPPSMLLAFGLALDVTATLTIGEQELTSLALIEMALEKDEEMIDALQAKADRLRHKEIYDQAMRALDKIDELSPNNIACMTTRALCHYEQRQYEATIAVAERIPQEHKSPFLRIVQAYCYSLNEALENAIGVLRLVDDAPFSHANQALYLSTYLSDAGRNEEALTYAQQGVTQFPKDAECYHRLFQCLFTLNREEEALEALREAVRLDSESQSRLCDMAMILRRCKQYKESERYARRAILLQETASAYCQLGRTLYHQDRNDEALDALRKAVQIDTHYTRGFLVMYDVYSSMGDDANANAMYKRIAMYETKDYEVLLSYTKACQYDSDERPRVLRTLRRVVAANRGGDATSIGLAVQALVRLSQMYGNGSAQPMLGVVYARDAVQLAPKNKDAIVALAEAYTERIRHEEVGKLYTDAGHDEDDAQLYYRRAGEAYMLAEQYARARWYLDRSLAMARARANGNDDDEEVKYVQKLCDRLIVQRTTPDSSEFRDALQQMDARYTMDSIASRGKDIWLANRLRADIAEADGDGEAGTWQDKWPLVVVDTVFDGREKYLPGWSDRQIYWVAEYLFADLTMRPLARRWLLHALQRISDSVPLLERCFTMMMSFDDMYNFLLQHVQALEDSVAERYRDGRDEDRDEGDEDDELASTLSVLWFMLGDYTRSIHWARLQGNRERNGAADLARLAASIYEGESQRAGEWMMVQAFCAAGGTLQDSAARPRQLFMVGNIAGIRYVPVAIDVRLTCLETCLDEKLWDWVPPNYYVELLRCNGRLDDALSVAEASMELPSCKELHTRDDVQLYVQYCALLLDLRQRSEGDGEGGEDGGAREASNENDDDD